jgi:predicted membrane-bound spermidine synthase
MNNEMSHKKTLLILFIEGFTSVALQIFIMRQLVPFVGNSVVIMSFVVGIFLAALSAGYFAGGNHKENHIAILSRNLIISGFLIAIGFSYQVLDSSFSLLNSIFDNPLIEVGVFLSFALFPTIFLLGQTIPLLTNYLKEDSVSQITGVALSINTAGSVLGSTITSLIFFYYFGMAITLLINVMLIVLLILFVSNSKNILKNIVISIALMSVATLFNLKYENETFIATTNYGNYEIRNIENEKYNYNLKAFVINKSYSSGIINNQYNFKYIEYLRKTIKDLNFKNKEILVLGAGGFTISVNDKNNNYTYVDIDPQIKEIVESNFLKEKIEGEFIAEDARVYVKNTKKKYDLVIVDLFTNYISIPWHVTTKEFMTDVYNITNKKGSVFLNIIASKNFDTPYSKMIHNTITSTFDYCYSVPFMDAKADGMNIEYICKVEEKEEKKIFIDNYSNAEYQSFNVK